MQLGIPPARTDLLSVADATMRACCPSRPTFPGVVDGGAWCARPREHIRMESPAVAATTSKRQVFVLPRHVAETQKIPVNS
eukprot:7380174-Prymnesium_polylepis.2